MSRAQNPPTLLLFSNLTEAEATLERLKAQRLSEQLYSHSYCDTLICGIGSHESIYRLTRLLSYRRYKRLISLGCCADLTATQALKIYTIKACIKALENGLSPHHSIDFFNRTFPKINTPPLGPYPRATLVSVDAPIHEKISSKRLRESGDLIDMEGYALSFVANQHELDLELLRCVSDFASESGHELILQSLKKVSEKLLFTLQELGIIE